MKTVEKDGMVIYPVSVPAEDNLQSINFYLVKHDESLSLIDAGIQTEACWEAFVQTMKQSGNSIRDVTEIILTHHHPDHVGLVNRILRERDIPVYASERAVPWLRREEGFVSMRTSFLEQLYREMDCGVPGERETEKIREAAAEYRSLAIHADLRTVREGDKIGAFEVIEVPGHAPDHIALYDSRRKLFMAGDHIIKHVNVNAIVEPDPAGNRLPMLAQYIQSLRRCLALEIDVAYSGHGEAVDRPHEWVLTRLAHIEAKSKKLLEMIQGGIATASKLAQAYYGAKYESVFFLVMSEIVGHLDWLEAKGSIRKESKHGVVYYYANY